MMRFRPLFGVTYPSLEELDRLEITRNVDSSAIRALGTEGLDQATPRNENWILFTHSRSYNARKLQWTRALLVFGRMVLRNESKNHHVAAAEQNASIFACANLSERGLKIQLSFAA